MGRRLLKTGALAVVLAFSCQCGVAEVLLSGTRDRMVLQADDATIPEALAALRGANQLQIDLTGSSTRKLTGRYSGSLRQVLTRLLKGEDYVMRSTADGISIHLFGANSLDRSAPPAPPASQGSRLIALRQGVLKRTNESP